MSCFEGTLLSILILISLVLVWASEPKNSTSFSARGLGRSLAHCFGGHEKVKCFEMQLIHTIDAALQDNNTWNFNDFIALEKRQGDDKNPYLSLWTANAQQRSLSDTIGEKLLHLASSRTIRLQLPHTPTALSELQIGISDALEDFGPNGDVLGADEGTVRLLKGLIDDKIASFTDLISKKGKKKGKKKKKIWYLLNKNPLKGRKKKDKDKNMAMMGGMAMLAMVAQMFLGKVILIAGAAFVMAKIALLVAVLGSLKSKSAGGGGGGGTDRVIVTSSGGGHGHDHSHGHESSSGWHRSMPYEYTKYEDISQEQLPDFESDFVPSSGIGGPQVESPTDFGSSKWKGSDRKRHISYQIGEQSTGGGEGGGGVGKRKQTNGFLH